MKAVYSAFSHIQLKESDAYVPDFKRTSPNSDIIQSCAKSVDTYSQLATEVAKLAYYNRDQHLFFRGQPKDVKDKDGNTSIQPSIFRPEENGKVPVKDRLKILNEKSEKLRKDILYPPNGKQKFKGTYVLNKHEVVRWAILQHYEVCKTPLIDLTHSLLVACSFVLNNIEQNSEGYIFVIALPTITDSISYHTNQELFNIRLLNFCPPQAKRPFLQEAYGCGHFPLEDLKDPKKKKQFNFSRRLIGKFKIKNHPHFFPENFNKIPDNLLAPDSGEDKFRNFLKRIDLL